MNKIDWSRLAAISEIVGTVAIIISLAFVARSVNQNTDALRSTNLNHVYDRLDSMNSDIASNPRLAVTYANKVLGLQDIEADEAQFLFLVRRELNQWEQYFGWYMSGEMNEDDWVSWDDYYKMLFTTAFPKEWWLATRKYYGPNFAAHVDQIYEP